MTVQTDLVIAPAMTFVAACRVEFPVNPVLGHVIAAVRDHPVRTITELGGRFHGVTGGMAVVTERPLVAGGAETTVLSGIVTMVDDEIGGVIEGGIGLENPLELILVALGAVHPPLFQRLGMGRGKITLLCRNHAITGAQEGGGQCRYWYEESRVIHFRDSFPAEVKL